MKNGKKNTRKVVRNEAIATTSTAKVTAKKETKSTYKPWPGSFEAFAKFTPSEKKAVQDYMLGIKSEKIVTYGHILESAKKGQKLAVILKSRPKAKEKQVIKRIGFAKRMWPELAEKIANILA